MKVTWLFVMPLIGLTLTGCLTTKHSVPSDKTTICLALLKADPLDALTPDDKKLIREGFSREGKDALKMARAIRIELKCGS